ncbi:MAG: ATP-binding protein [Pseudomonadota bacterium]
MSFAWLKHLMPRGLYGRAALILVLPVVTIQLVVSLVFIQRHYEDVTRQMTRSLVIDIAYVLATVDGAAGIDAARAAASPVAAALDLGLELPAPRLPQDEGRAFYDLSGRVLIETLRDGLPALDRVNLAGGRQVAIGLNSRFGLMTVTFDRRRVSASNPHQLLVVMAATSLLMTLIAFLFLRNQLRPIQRLARAAEAFGRGEVVPYRPSGATEVRVAGNAFLDMRGRIDRQRESRTLMLSGVSHDLRTPLTRLRLGLSMLPEDDETSALTRDVDEMQRLVDAFLAFARDDAEDEPPEDVDPAELCRSLVADFQRMGHDVTLAVEGGPVRVRIRPHAMRRALDNLVGNAVRYGRRARLTVTVLERALRFSVEDDGPGIPRERRDEAIRPFTRLDAARNQNRGSGVGLGLTIAADIARSHGGTLRLGESADLGGLKAELVLAR